MCDKQTTFCHASYCQFANFRLWLLLDINFLTFIYIEIRYECWAKIFFAFYFYTHCCLHCKYLPINYIANSGAYFKPIALPVPINIPIDGF